jgi:DNA invertase Pin-like site-specific DNA recombinase
MKPDAPEKPKQKGAKTAYSLIRFSTDRQEWGDSLRRQISRCQDECRRRGWKFDQKLCITDLGVSAFGGNNFDRRYALGKFIEASKKGLLLPNPVLLIENLDRFSRDTLDNADTEFWGLIKRGVDVLVLSMGGEPLTRGDENKVEKRAIVMFEFDRAHRESERKSDLITSVMAQKIADASNGLHVAIGNWAPKWVSFKGSKGQPGEYVPNKKWATVEWIVNSYLDGMSTNAIAKELKRRGEPLMAKHGKKWTQGNVRHILGSEALIGQVTIKGQTFKNYFPAVLRPERWSRLEAKLKQNKIRRGGISEGESIANLFRNRCKCVKCGGTITALTMATGRRYYKCKEARMGGECVKRMLPVHRIEEDFFGLYLMEHPAGVVSKHDTKHEEKVAQIQKRIRERDAEIKKVAAAVRQTNNLPEVVAELNRLQAERQKEKETLDAENQKMMVASTAPVAFANIRKLVHGTDDHALDDAFRSVIEALKDNEVRKKLLLLIPSLIQGLVIDLEKGCYAVRTHTDKLSTWRDVFGPATIGP